MKKALKLTSVVFLLVVAIVVGLHYAGGSFKYRPEALQTDLSPAARELLQKALEDIPAGSPIDHHVHVVGLNTNESGTWVNPKMLSWAHPVERIKTITYLSGSNVTDLDKADKQYIDRLVALTRQTPGGGKWMLLGFDYRYDQDGRVDLDRSEFHTPNEYVVQLAERYPDVFIPAVSVHPHRADAVEKLDHWASLGVRYVKWLPNALGINASDERHDGYYQTLIKNNMVLLTHVGEEQAVEAKEDQALGNPLLFRHPLDLGVTVVMAHSASLGTNEDLDNPGVLVSNFELFLRLMDNPKYEGLLYGELSAMSQINRLPEPLKILLRRSDLHHRLINGSDYPLPAINVVIHTRALVKHGMLTANERVQLNEIYHYNPLLFDFVLKRTIRDPDTGNTFSPEIFTGAALGSPYSPSSR